MLTDSLGRELSYLRLSITDVCNYRCNYCLPDGYQCEDKTQPLSLSEIQQLALVFARQGTRKIRITGGEPTLRKDLVDIIRVLKSTPGIEQVVLTTNGYKLNQRVESWIDAGLDGLNVSVDSLDPGLFQAITGHNRLEELLEGIDTAQKAGLKKIKVNAVLLKSYNLAQFEHFLNWVKQSPITLRFIELMETSDNRDYFRANHVSGASIQQKLENSGWVQKIRSKDAGPAKEFEHPEYAGNIGLIMPYSKDFCKSCNRLRISSLGKLHLCLFGEQGHDLRPLLTAEKEMELESTLLAYLHQKRAGHFLHEGNTGMMKHLAMLGG